MSKLWMPFATVVLLWICLDVNAQDPNFQYRHGDIAIPKPSVDEPTSGKFSMNAALDYLDKGALAWARDQKCVSCHTTGTYMLVRPQLVKKAGKPSQELFEFFQSELRRQQARPRQQLKLFSRPEEVIYLAAGLAQWDAHISGKLSTPTEQALQLMFELQLPSGTWGIKDCWPPLESSPFHAATVAALAVATAPGWLPTLQNSGLRHSVERLKEYLRSNQEQNDYDRVSLLWAASKIPDLLNSDQRQNLIDLILRLQRPDGGWSIRSFSSPEKWGSGLRAERLRKEPDFEHPSSDGHMTGLAVLVLREAGLSKGDRHIQHGVEWLHANQKQSGRWWTKSLNTENWQFITYSGTAYPLLALALCDAL
jgi:squalene-hopene/tetraprenyl-beta-curcumene cyclase